MTDSTPETRSPQFGREASAVTYRDIHLPRIFLPWAHVLVDVVPSQPGEAVLDVATGPGTVARLAALQAGRAGRVVGVDVSSAMLAIAHGWTADADAAPIEYVECSATSMPLPNAAFDVAYCQQGLQHMSDPLAALREMRRVLKPNARIALAVWVASPFGLFREVVAGLRMVDNGPQPSDFGRDGEGLAGVLRGLGFRDVLVEPRELVSILEGGIPEALQVAEATAISAAMLNSSAEQATTIRAAIATALEPYAQPDGVYLSSTANIASAHL